MNGKNDVSCSLYIEVVNSANFPDAVNCDIDSSNWRKVTAEDDFQPVYGGTLYKYQETLYPHTSMEIKYLSVIH